MASITSWTRLEPRVRRQTIHEGLQARVHDPLWLLARQWQLGEFFGEDAGSPVAVRLRAEASRLTRYHAGPLQAGKGPLALEGRPYDAHRMPLEAFVEREGQQPGDGMPGRAAEAGAHFLRLLDASGVGKHRQAYVAHYPIEEPGTSEGGTEHDAASLRFLRVMARSVPDGVRLYHDLRRALAGGALPEAPALPEADQEALRRAMAAWLAWYEDLYGAPEAEQEAWTPERMEYAFAVAAPASNGERVLVANEYPGGHLDWYSFDAYPGASLGAAGDAGASGAITRTVIPTPVRYRGMPAARWWQFEDAQVDFGAVDAAPEDLGRMLLIEFAMTYSDDWFVVPVELEVGTLCQVRSLVVTDTFGERLLVRPYTEVDGVGAPWRLFSAGLDPRATGGQPPAGALFLPPVLGPSLEGQPVEEVLFLRDEMANMAWGVERTVPSAVGRPLDRHEAFLARRSEAPPPAPLPDDPADLVYRLATRVPDHWIPLVPVSVEQEKGALRLQRGRMVQVRGGEATPGPRGRILEPDRPLRLCDEEVPRDGARVTRAYQYARWADGSTHLWMGRRKRPGRGEGWSGLRFDVVEEAPQP